MVRVYQHSQGLVDYNRLAIKWSSSKEGVGTIAECPLYRPVPITRDKG